MLLRENKFIIIAPLSAVSKRVRLFKITKFLYHSGIKNFEHIGWERLPGESQETNLEFDLGKKIIMKGGGYGGNKIKFMYLLWMLKVFLMSFRIKKSDKVWALGFESAFPLLLASKIKGFRIYFDDADRFSMLFKFPLSTNKILEVLEKITSRNVFKHIIPLQERYDFTSKNFFILSNTPSKTEVDAAYEIFGRKKWIEGDLIININGWLGSGRGMSAALELCKKLENENIGFILAGKLDCEEAEILAQQKNVQYLGRVTNAEALASYFASDFVFTYYDPKSKVNRYAASNKWGDAIKTKTGIIVNNEVVTASHLIKSEVAISCAYDDHKTLVQDIKGLCKNAAGMENIKDKINLLSQSTPYFEDQLKLLFSYETK